MIEEFDIRDEDDSTDKEFEYALRPQQFEDFVGQDKVVENLKIFILLQN